MCRSILLLKPLSCRSQYFSTLERLRFAQDSGTIYHHYDDISAHKIKRRKSRQDRSASDRFATRLRRQSQLPPADSLILENLPDKIKRREFSREDQLVLARRLRASVILDAADEAIYKIGRRASKTRNVSSETTPTLSHQPSMESVQSDRLPAVPAATKEAGVPDSFYNSFRWLDDEEDLDLRLFMDDYHTNLREALPVPAKEHRPSFRRHLSITKIPFGRSSLSSSRPATKDASTPNSPLFSPPGTANGPPHIARRSSRALSLITPRHAPNASIVSIDAAAAHYQDPEARLKLRVYLASPQKFDEAIEFGFPSADALAASPVIAKASAGTWKASSRQRGADEFEHMKTFLADDDDDEEDKLDSDHGSSPESESPKTPHLDARPAAMRVSTDPPYSQRLSENYAQVPASSREMTLRMTLTRPDLRAHEEQIYGWQGSRRSQSTSMRGDDMAAAPTYIGEGRPKESIENMLAGVDHWGPDPADGGVMKRFWNKVRRS